jgi:hypothetical protein
MYAGALITENECAKLITPVNWKKIGEVSADKPVFPGLEKRGGSNIDMQYRSLEIGDYKAVI